MLGEIERNSDHPRACEIGGSEFAEGRSPMTESNGRMVVLIETLSYSLYLWQQLFIARNLPGGWHAFPWNLGCALVAAYLSYIVVEKPFLELRSLLGARLVGRLR
jgi:peptidoglycan/LPS O-acetylase OafA/YrhL